ncbi:MAG: penicillin-binding protein 2, partial [Phycisphaerae bacterium]|nr:penicillin-binding protein 2 [Phycisphaerae bacterium]
IDAVIQEQAELELEKAVKKFHAKSGTAIVMDPKTGEVLALANYPAFDLNDARMIGPELKRNQALTDPYEPGSTFKPITVAAGIQGGFVRIDQKINCLDRPYVGKGFGRIREYKRYHGVLSVADIIVKSSNIGVAKIAQMMGDDYFYEMIEKFGFGRKTGIDLPGEGVGQPHERVRKDGSLYTLSQQLKAKYGPGYTLTRVSFGQGISVTPIQLIRGFCVLVNGGRLVKPRIVNGVVHQGEVVENYYKYRLPGTYKLEGAAWNIAGMAISPEVSRQVIDKALINVVRQEGGTAHRQAQLEKWQVFGKTGTANIPKKNGKGYEAEKWNSSFIAGAPAANPRLCVLVTIREPDRGLGLGYTGGVVAGPVVREVLRHALTYMRVPGDLAEAPESVSEMEPRVIRQ